MAITFRTSADGTKTELLHNGVVVGEIDAAGLGGSGVSFDPAGTGLVATDVQSAVAELTDPDNGGTKQALNASGNAPIYACRAWVNFDGTTTSPTIKASGNVSSVTKNGTGDYTVNFTTAMPDANYAINPDVGAQVTGTQVPIVSNLFTALANSDSGGRSTGAFRHIARRVDNSTVLDVTYASFTIFR